MTFKWEWCDNCQMMMVICPKCGNNCCNGMHGDNGECDVCNLAYEYQELAYKSGLVPERS